MSKANNRILSLDVFRGLTIVLMILVNNPGTLQPYPILDHANWSGCTLADLVFPFFLYIVGITTVISLRRQIKEGLETRASIYTSVFKRSLILFAIGIFLNAFPTHFYFDHFRFCGVLQRIAICYLLGALIYLNTGIKTQILIFSLILLGYWVVMTQIPAPGFGVNQLTPEGSWVAYLDQLLFTVPHILTKTYDPEGFFSTFPALATTISGLLTGAVLLNSQRCISKFYLIAFLGVMSLLFGSLWGWSFPINKNLWTSSYVLLTSGYAAIVFALCYLIIDIEGYRKWALPLKVFGVNALFAFIFHVMLLKIQAKIPLAFENGTPANLKLVITERLFGGFSLENAALLYAVSFIVLNFVVVLFLYRRRWFLKI